MLPNPTYEDKSKLVHMSNLKRTLPEGDGCKTIQSLTGFKSSVEMEKTIFNLRNISGRLNGIYDRGASRGNSRVDISFHGCLEYSRSQGGKTGEFIDKVINDFLELPLGSHFPCLPERNLYDFTGHLVLRPDDWDWDTPIWKVLYPELRQDDAELDKLDNRLGQVALLWALITMRSDEDVNITVANEFYSSCCSYEPVAVVRFNYGTIRARVSPQPEEGFKVRVITITSLAVSFIGAVARHLLDEHLWSNVETKIGLLSKIKLYTFMDHYGGKKTSDYPSGLFNCLPEWAESVDLTTATDTPPREHIHDIIHGHIDAMRHKSEVFLRFAADVACSERRFVLDKGVKGPCPDKHNCGIMMGEGLSGVFLNNSSNIIRSLAYPFSLAFDSIRGMKTISNTEASSFIEQNKYAIQSFLDHTPLVANKAGSQSGDDVINFSNGPLSVSFRILYIVFGFIPSESTWYSSNTYCTFTEEGAIRTWDSNGWKFVDSFKPRAFSTGGSDPEGKILVSKLKLVSSYMRYFPVGDPRKDRAIQFANDMIDSHPAWKRLINKYDIPIGWPEFLGGIGHPIGMMDNYSLTLSEDNIRVLKGLSKMNPFEAFSHIYEIPEDIQDLDVEDEIRLQIDKLLFELSQFTVLDSFIESDCFLFDVSELVPQQRSWWQTSESRKKFMKENNLSSISQFVDSFIQGQKLKFLLTRDRSLPRQKSWNQSKNRVMKLRSLFSNEQTSIEDYSELTTWKIRESIMNRISAIAVPNIIIKRLITGISLPRLDLSFRHLSAVVDQSGVPPSDTPKSLMFHVGTS